MDAKSKPERLPFFVYGTLIPGQPNAYLWGKRIVASETAVLPGARLFDMGHYPMLVEGGAGRVYGRLIRPQPHAYHKILTRLDILEGYDPQQPDTSPYRRESRSVVLADGGNALAWVYIGDRRSVTGKLAIESGDWVRHAAARRRQMFDWWSSIQSVQNLHNLDDAQDDAR